MIAKNFVFDCYLMIRLLVTLSMGIFFLKSESGRYFLIYLITLLVESVS